MEELISKNERLEEFFRRLGSAPPAKTFDEAYSQICNILNEVEDEMTSIPFRPDNWRADGRLYPPQLDNIRAVPDRSNITRLRSIAHNIFIGENGSIEIQTVKPQVIVFSKRGEDGKKVWDL